MKNNKTSCKIILGFVITSSVFLLPRAEASIVVNQQVDFSSTGQSMWGSGNAGILDETQFLGLQWDKSRSVNLIAGNANELVPGTGGSLTNPLYPIWQGCIGVTPGFLENKICGSAPSKTVSNPIPAQYIDTRTGVAGTASTSGRVGFEVGLKANSGSVDTTVGFDVSLDVPDSITAGQYVNLLGSSNLNAGSLNTNFPTLEASLSLVAEASASFTGTGCILLTGCTSGTVSTGKIGGTYELLSVNQDGTGGIEYFNGDPILNALLTQNADPITGFPVTASSPYAGVTVHLPKPDATGGVVGNSLKASGQSDLVDALADVDAIVSTGLTGTPYAFGGNLSFGSIGSVDFTLLDVKLGPTIDLKQDFEFTPSLYVDLAFSQPVDVLGLGSVTEASNLLFNALPQLAFLDGETWVTPTLFLGFEKGGNILRGVELLNELFLDVDGTLRVDALTATLDLLGVFSLDLGVGNIFDGSLDLFTSPAFFSSQFGMGGFKDITLDSFRVATNGYTPVPEPGSLILLGLGLLALVFTRQNSYSRNKLVA